MKSLFKHEPLIEELPPEILSAYTALNAALTERAELLRGQAQLAIEEPAAAAAAAAGAADYDDAETALAMATDKNVGELTKIRDEKKSEVEAAQAALETLHRRQRGIAAKLIEASTDIEAAYAAWRAVDQPFRAELRTRCRKQLLADITPLAHTLRMAFAIEKMLPGCGLRTLESIVIPDIEPQPGRPFPCLLK
jgi:hypothetical protein